MAGQTAPLKTDQFPSGHSILGHFARELGAFALPSTHRANPYFVSRSDIQARIDTMGWGDVLVLCGLGGMGKTQYAVQHAHEARLTYSNVIWAFADTPDTLRTSLAVLCEVPELGISISSDATLIEKLREIRRWLQNATNWLLILDNADSVDSARAIERILPPVHRGRVIITARITEWSSAFNVQPIDAWAEAQSVQFLMQRLGGRQQDSELLAKLAETLGGLPLALEQASAYIVHTHVSVTEYLATFGTIAASF